jgi:hypothetical protein
MSTGVESYAHARAEKLTKVHIRLARQYQGFCPDALHRGGKVAVVGRLCRDVATLPRVEHCEHVLGVFLQWKSAAQFESSYLTARGEKVPLDSAQASQNLRRKSSRSLKPRAVSYNFSR